MKEADDGTGTPGQAAAAPDPNNKAEKDMKGLVYQGAEPVAPTQDDSAYSPDAAPQEAQAAAGESPDKQISSRDSILSFSEKEDGGRRILLIAAIVIVIAVIAAVVIFIHPSIGKVSITTTTVAGKTTTSTIGPNLNKTKIVSLDWSYNYTGPSNALNGTPCNFRSGSQVTSSPVSYLNASSILYLTYYVTAGNCALTVTKISTTSRGFKVLNVTPVLPQHVVPNSPFEFAIQLRTPPTNFTGIVSIIISEN